jgi:predicted DNA-binding protein with PD1-like motif
MKWKAIDEGAQRTFAVVFASGDAFSQEFTAFASDVKLSAASFTAIGALSSVTLAWFNPVEQNYEQKSFSEQMEVLSLAGNVVEHDGRPKVHAHIVLGRRDFSTIGGHLVEGLVRPTLEVILVESPRHLQRRHNPTVGLPLIALDV